MTKICRLCELKIRCEMEPLPCYGLILVAGTPKYVCSRCIYDLNEQLCEDIERFGIMVNAGKFFPPLITKALSKKA